MICCVFSKIGGACGRLLAVILAVALGAGVTALVVRAAGADKGDKAVDQRVYELRTYHIAPGKADALHARFRDHTLQLFDKHGLKVETFWKPLDDKAAEETLVYVLSFSSKDAADKAWKEFRDDPDWKKVKADSEKDGPLVTKVDSVYLTPTDYAPTK
jgi:hypothetical protein